MMYWCLWAVSRDGKPLLENVQDEFVDVRVEESREGEIIFEAELVTE